MKCDKCGRTILKKWHKVIDLILFGFAMIGIYMVAIGIYLLITGGFNK